MNPLIIFALLTKRAIAAVPAAVNAWLDSHPEATTTVQDGSITLSKLASSVSATQADIDGIIQIIEGGE